MSEGTPRRPLPVTEPRSRPPHPSPPLHRRSPTARRSSKPSRSLRILRRYPSDSSVSPDGRFPGDDHLHPESDEGVLFRLQTCADILSYPCFLSPSPQIPEVQKKANKDSKVVVNVTVEGSSGPIRALVRLGSSVEETIMLVVNKYGEEGRSPKLDRHAASSFQLHQSYFSLQGLNKSDVIGEVGCRSFYLRKSSSSSSNRGDGHGMQLVSASSNPQIDSVRATSPPPFICFTAFIEQCIRKIVRRTRKLWKVLGCTCMQSG
ncbi:uncharacterized protein At4g22758 [Malania oleifera]|uniref:uncharacterized protein At4g22758 n=1 Tax=Malania oleifera TaxID=397392 RepID=UPI0025ADBAF9|nr:uncharacterized protein At4g22758 [Malania oleifera]